MGLTVTISSGGHRGSGMGQENVEEDVDIAGASSSWRETKFINSGLYKALAGIYNPHDMTRPATDGNKMSNHADHARTADDADLCCGNYRCR
jgi:hypothetical protein